ncbi:unnamed protein product [[Candida] boidinii]|nr:unnamed protein product [[Candida] boidinii]
MISIVLKDFNINYVNFEVPEESHSFSSIKNDDFMESSLRIRNNADISKRFPDLYELMNAIKSELLLQTPLSPSQTFLSIPLLHGMIKMFPPAPDAPLLNGHYNAITKVQLTNLPAMDEHWCALTTVYSFGRSIVTSFEKLEPKLSSCPGGRKNATFNVRIAVNYWGNFFKSIFKLMNEPKFNGQNPQDVLTKAIRGITIKQVIFACDSQEYQKKLEPSRATTLDDVKKTQVRAILLWECLKVDKQEDAFTTFRRIHLPTNLEEQYERQQRNLLEQTSQEQTKALKDHNPAMLENINKHIMTSSPLATKSEEFKQPMNLNFFQKKPLVV